MPAEMIELEEVTMVEVCDEALETVVGRGGAHMSGFQSYCFCN